MSDIHVAPCQCELHVRIRELEAELAIETKHSDALIVALERLAEEFRRPHEIDWYDAMIQKDTWKARAERAEAFILRTADRVVEGDSEWQTAQRLAREREASK